MKPNKELTQLYNTMAKTLYYGLYAFVDKKNRRVSINVSSSILGPLAFENQPIGTTLLIYDVVKTDTALPYLQYKAFKLIKQYKGYEVTHNLPGALQRYDAKLGTELVKYNKRRIVVNITLEYLNKTFRVKQCSSMREASAWLRNAKLDEIIKRMFIH